jgi:hypothetical protein
MAQAGQVHMRRQDSKQSHYILTDNILLSTIEKIATSYHTQPNFLPKQKNSSGN